MLEDNIHQVKKTTLSQNIVQQLMEIIIDGTISTGEKLPSEKQLMEMFGVGRSTLREAIRALIALGLVEVRVPEGTFVVDSFGNFFTKHLELMSKINFDSMSELIEARLKLEVILTEMAAYKSKKEDHEKLDQMMGITRKADSNSKFIQSDLDFHLLIAKIADNSYLFEVMNILQGITKGWIIKVSHEFSEPTKRDIINEHQKIVDTIKNNDGLKAKAAMTAHLQTVSKILESFS